MQGGHCARLELVAPLHCYSLPDAYPAGTPEEHYGPEDADTALLEAEAVMEFVSSWWPEGRQKDGRGGDVSVEAALGVRAVVVFGSVARGDYNVWSDIDVLVVVEDLPDNPLRRLEMLGSTPALVQPVAWMSSEWQTQLARHNPIAVEAIERGVWLVGSPEDL